MVSKDHSARKSFLFPSKAREIQELHYIHSHHNICQNVNNAKENKKFYAASEFTMVITCYIIVK